MCNKDYQEVGMFNSLRSTHTTSRSNMSLSLCLRFTLIKQHLDMYTYKADMGQIVVPTAEQAEEATHPTATKVEEDERR